MTSNVYNRLLEDSLKKKQRIINTGKLERYPEEMFQWEKKLLACNFLSIPRLNSNGPLLKTTRDKNESIKSKDRSLSAFDVISNCAPSSSSFMSFPPRQMRAVKMETGGTVTSSITKKTPKLKQKSGFTNSEQVKLPKLNKTKKIDMHSHESIMNDPNMNGVESFPLPPFSLPKGFDMVPCKSSLIAFYDMQGTY